MTIAQIFRWPPFVGTLLAVAPLLAANLGRYRLLPRPVFYAVVAVMLALAIIALIARMNRRPREEQLAIQLLLITGLALTVANLTLLIILLTTSKNVKGEQLLISGLLIWYVNIVIFAQWYWFIDRQDYKTKAAGGRAQVDLIFPEMSQSEHDASTFRPNFMDYLYVSFSTATAFSATDTACASTTARILLMIEAAISLATVAIVAARAVNILS